MYKETCRSLDETSTSWTSLIAIPIPPPRLHLGVFFVYDLLRFDRHVDDVRCKTIGETGVLNAYQYYKEFKGSEQIILPDNRDLSLSILPMEIRRIDSGLDGLASHSAPRSVSEQACSASHDHPRFIRTFPPVSQYKLLQFV